MIIRKKVLIFLISTILLITAVSALSDDLGNAIHFKYPVSSGNGSVIIVNGSSGNPFDQWLNTTDVVDFQRLILSNITVVTPVNLISWDSQINVPDTNAKFKNECVYYSVYPYIYSLFDGFMPHVAEPINFTQCDFSGLNFSTDLFFRTGYLTSGFFLVSSKGYYMRYDNPVDMFTDYDIPDLGKYNNLLTFYVNGNTAYATWTAGTPDLSLTLPTNFHYDLGNNTLQVNGQSSFYYNNSFILFSAKMINGQYYPLMSGYGNMGNILLQDNTYIQSQSNETDTALVFVSPDTQFIALLSMDGATGDMAYVDPSHNPLMTLITGGRVSIGNVDGAVVDDGSSTFQVYGNANITSTVSAGGGSANHITCWMDDGVTLGYCSDAPAGDGSCTCNIGSNQQVMSRQHGGGGIRNLGLRGI